MKPAVVAVIGGSGLYEIDGFKVEAREDVPTPFGAASAEVVIGDYGGVRVAFLPRHGIGHRYSPGILNYRANIWALKSLGVQRVVSVSAVGSLKLAIEPRHFVVPDQFYDNTKGRASTFFDEGPVVHVTMADPYCPELRRAVVEACRGCNITAHDGGTYLCMEGPQFSTRAESRAYRQLGFDVIGMTSATEAKLAREAEICYVTVALVTDYDVWHVADVTVDMILENMSANVANVKAMLAKVLPAVEAAPACGCQKALVGAIVTDPNLISAETKKKLEPILGRHI